MQSDNRNIKILRHDVQGKNNLGKPHKHDFNLIFIIEEGSGTHFIDFNEYEVQDYQIFFLAPRQVQHWILDINTSGYHLMFTDELLKQERLDLFLPYFKLNTESYLKIDNKDFYSLLICFGFFGR